MRILPEWMFCPSSGPMAYPLSFPKRWLRKQKTLPKRCCLPILKGAGICAPLKWSPSTARMPGIWMTPFHLSFCPPGYIGWGFILPMLPTMSGKEASLITRLLPAEQAFIFLTGSFPCFQESSPTAYAALMPMWTDWPSAF